MRWVGKNGGLFHARDLFSHPENIRTSVVRANVWVCPSSLLFALMYISHIVTYMSYDAKC